MNKRTIIYLHSIELAQASWVVCDGLNIEKSILRGHLSDLSTTDKQHEIIIFVPAVDILLTEVTLPKLSRQRLIEALPFALEEQLIDDVHELHFAIGPYQTNSHVPVAIVAQKKLTEWITLFKQYDITPRALYSAVFLLPFVENNWSVSLLQEAFTVRQSKYQGFCGEQINLSNMLEFALESASEKPECINIDSTIENFPEINHTKFESITIHSTSLSEQSWLEKFPQWTTSTFGINLLQNKYQPKHKASETKKIWIGAACAFAAWILLAFLGELVSFFILNHETNRTETAINQIYKKNFPQATSVVSPRERMTNKLSSLEEQANKNYFLVLLAKVGQPLMQSSQVHLKTMDFRDGQLTLEVTAAQFSDLDKLHLALTQQGLKVKQQNATVAGTQVKASIIIQRGTS